MAHRLERAPPLYPQGKATGRPGRLPPLGNTPPHAPKGGQPAGLYLPGPPHDSPRRSPARPPRTEGLHWTRPEQDPPRPAPPRVHKTPGPLTRRREANETKARRPTPQPERPTRATADTDNRGKVRKLSTELCLGSIWKQQASVNKKHGLATWAASRARCESGQGAERKDRARTEAATGWGAGAKSERTYRQACLPRHDARSLRPAGGIHAHPVCTEAFARPTHLHHPGGFNHTALPRGCVPPNGPSCGSTCGPRGARMAGTGRGEEPPVARV